MPGKHQVQDRHVGNRGGGRGDRLLAVRGHLDLEAFHAEVDLQQPKDGGVVIDEEHTRHGLSIRADVPLAGAPEAGC